MLTRLVYVKGLQRLLVTVFLDVFQDYFQPLLSMSHGLLACKEPAARQLGSHVYVLLFEEFIDAYHRQEVIKHGILAVAFSFSVVVILSIAKI